MSEPQQIEHLLIVEDQRGKCTTVLESATCSIGRDSTNFIVLKSSKVSRHHATLLRVTMPDTSHHLFRLIDGDLQGKRSTNGLTVNGRSCFSHNLRHGDEIVFGDDVRARYYTTDKHSDVEYLTSCKAEDVSSFLPNLESATKTQISLDSEREGLTEAALERLASFPELISNPIIEIDLPGNITYLNPAAAEQFPDLCKSKLQHPVLAGIVSRIQDCQETFFVREVAVADKIFEQSVHYLVASKLIRSYATEITERKRAETLLQKAHDQLESRVEKRTAELALANQSLKVEIAERQRVEEALRSSMATNRALLDAIPDSMFRISKEGVFVNFKAAKENNLPMASREFLGKHLYEAFPEEVAKPTINCVQRALATGEVQFLECQLLVNDELRDYEVRIVVSAENEAMAICRDITERKQAEQDIRNALEKEKRLNELKSRFINMASHEFRTPLATILSSAELIEHYSQKWSEEKKFKHLQRIQTAVKHMTGLLNDVLLIGKAEADKLEFKPAILNVEQFCRELVEEIQLATNGHTVILRAQKSTGTLSCCAPALAQNQGSTACLDEKLLRLILSNLLSNAIKYSPRSNVIYFDLIIEPKQAVIRIQDRGIGIPAEDQAQLFDSFHRASNVGSISGTGLGLAIVKKAVDLHEGKIEVQSKVEIGTTFTVTLPYAVIN